MDFINQLTFFLTTIRKTCYFNVYFPHLEFKRLFKIKLYRKFVHLSTNILNDVFLFMLIPLFLQQIKNLNSYLNLIHIFKNISCSLLLGKLFYLDTKINKKYKNLT